MNFNDMNYLGKCFKTILPAVFDDSLTVEMQIGKLTVAVNQLIENDKYFNDVLKKFLIEFETNLEDVIRKIISEGDFDFLLVPLREEVVSYIKENHGVNVRDYGAKGDGVTDDSIAIQTAIDQNADCEIIFPGGTYVIGKTINIPDRGIMVNLGGSRIIPTENNSPEYLFHFNATERLEGCASSMHGGIIDGLGISNCIFLDRYAGTINNMTIANFKKYGLKENESYISSQKVISNVFVLIQHQKYGGSEIDRTGIWLYNDTQLSNISVLRCRVGIYVNSPWSQMTNIHIWGNIWNDLMKNWDFFKNVYGIELSNYATCSVSDYYADDVRAAFYQNGWNGNTEQCTINCKNLYYIINEDAIQGNPTENEYCYIILGRGTFSMDVMRAEINEKYTLLPCNGNVALTFSPNRYYHYLDGNSTIGNYTDVCYGTFVGQNNGERIIGSIANVDDTALKCATIDMWLTEVSMSRLTISQGTYACGSYLIKLDSGTNGVEINKEFISNDNTRFEILVKYEKTVLIDGFNVKRFGIYAKAKNAEIKCTIENLSGSPLFYVPFSQKNPTYTYSSLKTGSYSTANMMTNDVVNVSLSGGVTGECYLQKITKTAYALYLNVSANSFSNDQTIGTLSFPKNVYGLVFGTANTDFNDTRMAYVKIENNKIVVENINSPYNKKIRGQVIVPIFQ